MNQRALQYALKGEHANALPLTLEAPLMRLSVASLRRVVKGDLTIQFGSQALTSYGGLELLGRYLRRIDLVARLRQTFAGLRSDYTYTGDETTKAMVVAGSRTTLNNVVPGSCRTENTA